jgi:cytochrome c1
MKQHKNELDVDFIGGAAPLTKEEEKAISEYIQAAKEREQKQASRRKARTANRSIAASKGRQA